MDKNDVAKVQISGLNSSQRYLFKNNQGKVVEMDLDDGRKATNDQKAKAHALIGEIDTWSGNYIYKATEAQLKYEFMSRNNMIEYFSMATCSVELARKWITFLLDFCFENQVPFTSATFDAIHEQYSWDMDCLKYRQCMICGKHADIAHVYAVGMGRNRNKINHIGNYVMALCRQHHNEQHNVGIETFMRRNQLKGVKVTKEIAKMLKLGNWHAEKGDPLLMVRPLDI